MSLEFSPVRFRRLLVNDALDMLRPLAYGALALLCGTLLVYYGNFEPGVLTDDPAASTVVFAIFLLGAGLYTSSVAFRDMHHPLARYQYLMLPVSNLERFLSRYLLTGPLFVLYAVVVFALADRVGNTVTWWLKDAREPLFSPFTFEASVVLRIYVVTHAVMLAGAILFRSLHLLKTVFWLFLIELGMVVVLYMAMRTFFAGAFRWTRFEAVDSIHLTLLPLFSAGWMNYAVATAFVLWVLAIAYRCLRAHQVQDEL